MTAEDLACLLRIQKSKMFSLGADSHELRSILVVDQKDHNILLIQNPMSTRSMALVSKILTVARMQILQSPALQGSFGGWHFPLHMYGMVKTPSMKAISPLTTTLYTHYINYITPLIRSFDPGTYHLPVSATIRSVGPAAGEPWQLESHGTCMFVCMLVPRMPPKGSEYPAFEVSGSKNH